LDRDGGEDGEEAMAKRIGGKTKGSTELQEGLLKKRIRFPRIVGVTKVKWKVSGSQLNFLAGRAAGRGNGKGLITEPA